jgi:hypothetical protein
MRAGKLTTTAHYYVMVQIVKDSFKETLRNVRRLDLR